MGSVMHCARTQEGYVRLASMCAALKWVLYKMKPKLHMQAEIVLLSCSTICNVVSTCLA